VVFQNVLEVDLGVRVDALGGVRERSARPFAAGIYPAL
jgi:hypothetical protein